MDDIHAAISAYKAGDKATARSILVRLVRANPQDTQAWLWLSACVETDEQRIQCLQRVLALDPANQNARQALARLQPVPPPLLPEAKPAPPETPKPAPALSSTQSIPASHAPTRSTAKKHKQETTRQKSSAKLTPKQTKITSIIVGVVLLLCVCCAIAQFSQKPQPVSPGDQPTAIPGPTETPWLIWDLSTDTPTPFYTPTPKPTRPPTTTPTPRPTYPASGFVLVDISTSARPGGGASAEISTQPGATCTITFVLPSGTVSTADGLTNRIADENGICRWFWDIRSNVKTGTGTVTISAGGQKQSYSFTIEK